MLDISDLDGKSEILVDILSKSTSFTLSSNLVKAFFIDSKSVPLSRFKEA